MDTPISKCLNNAQSQEALKALREDKEAASAKVRQIKRDLQNWRTTMTAQTETCQADLAALRRSVQEQLGAARGDFEILQNSLARERAAAQDAIQLAKLQRKEWCTSGDPARPINFRNFF